MIKNLGGRGVKADFPTIVKRIPKCLEPKIDEFIYELHKGISRDVEIPFSYLPPIEESMKIMNKILTRKKSAKTSCEQFLRYLYDRSDINLFS